MSTELTAAAIAKDLEGLTAESINPAPLDPSFLPGRRLSTTISPSLLDRSIDSNGSGLNTLAQILSSGSKAGKDSSDQLGHLLSSGEDEVVIPSHLYGRLPKHMMMKDEQGREVPDYLKLVLKSKTYAAPLLLKETPLTLAVHLSARFGCEIWLKREDLQPIFSFKIRGAYNMMAHFTAEEKIKGVITCSAGNHAQGVALAGQALSITAIVVMPTSSSSIKWRNVQRLGGIVILHGVDFEEAKAECLRLSAKDGLTFIPPYEHPYIIAGQGTVGMEICRQIPDIDEINGIFAGIGGGGLLSGMATYIRKIAGPEVGLYGVETIDGDAMDRSLKKGKRVTLDTVGPFADGTATTSVGEETFRLCKAALDGVVLVSNDELCVLGFRCGSPAERGEEHMILTVHVIRSHSSSTRGEVNAWRGIYAV